MKNFLFSTILTTALLPFLAGSAAAQNPACASGDAVCVDTDDANAGSGNPLTQVTARLPAQGIVAVGPQGLDPTTLYGFFDGDETTPDPLDGYLGISMRDVNKSVLGLVNSSQGNFNRDGGNEPLSPPSLPAPPPIGDLLQAVSALNPPSPTDVTSTVTSALGTLGR